MAFSAEPSTKSRRKQLTIIGPADDAILRALLIFRFLSSHQVCRLLYSRASITYVRTRLKRLSDARFCQKVFLPRASQYGSAPALYVLARRGINYLVSEGTEASQRYRPSEAASYSLWFIQHTLAVSDFLISVHLLTKSPHRVVLYRLMTEQELKRQPPFVRGPGEKRISVTPDAWMELHLGNTTQACLALECDRGTEDQRKWRQKVSGHIAWLKGPYRERFQVKSLTIVVTVPSNKRLFDLLCWTEAELKLLGDQTEADLYRFTSVSPDKTSPTVFFVSGGFWYRPFGYRGSIAPVKPTLSDYQPLTLLSSV